MIRHTFRTRASVCAIFLLSCIPAAQAQSEAQKKTVLDGVYSNAQAERGQSLYTANCGECHGNALDGVSAPPLKGNRFIERWREGALDPLYDFIRKTMPFGRRADSTTIRDNEYLDILTYILKVNGYQAGQGELTTSLLGNTMLVGMNGPQPVPDGSHVVTVGCLSQLGDGLWVLSNASEPARTPIESTSTPLQRSLGTLAFRLADLEAVPDFSLSAHVGHMLQVKGFLTRQPNAERISVSSMEMVDSSCGK